MLAYTDEQIAERGVVLGLIQPGESVPNNLRGKIVASLADDDRADKAPNLKQLRPAQSIVIEPKGLILVDDQVLPWMVAREPIEVVCNPHGPDTVRLTLLAEHATIVPPHDPSEDESENRA